MKKVKWILSIALIGFLCVAAQAEIAPGGFQGVFGDVESPFTLVEGATSGSTVSEGIVADISDQAIDLTGFVDDGDAVSVSNLVLSGTDTCAGNATYIWDFASLLRAPLTMFPQGAGAVTGNLTLQANDLHVVATNEAITLPQLITATMTYNGVVVESDGTNGYVASMTFPAASITAIAHVPEPSTIVGLLTLGLGAIFVWCKRK